MDQRCLCWPTKLGSRPEARIPTRPVTKDTPAALAFANVQCPLSWNAASGTLDSSGSNSRTAYWGWVSETQLTTPGPKCCFRDTQLTHYSPKFSACRNKPDCQCGLRGYTLAKTSRSHTALGQCFKFYSTVSDRFRSSPTPVPPTGTPPSGHPSF